MDKKVQLILVMRKTLMKLFHHQLMRLTLRRLVKINAMFTNKKEAKNRNYEKNDFTQENI